MCKGACVNQLIILQIVPLAKKKNGGKHGAGVLGKRMYNFFIKIYKDMCIPKLKKFLFE